MNKHQSRRQRRCTQQTFKLNGIIVVTVMCVLLFSTLNGTASQQTSQSIVVHYPFSEAVVEEVRHDAALFDHIVLTGAPNGGKTGEPSLPVKGAYILLPQGYTLDSVEVAPTGKHTLGCGYAIEPVSAPVSLDEFTAASVQTNQISYDSSQEYPDDVVSITGVYWCRGYQILVLQLYPVGYITSTGELYQYSGLTLKVVCSPSAESSHPLFRGSEKDRALLAGKVDNPEMIGTYQTHAGPALFAEPYDLLIVTTNDLKESFTRLKQYHDERGTRTEICTLQTDIVVHPDFHYTAKYIRDYIREEYQSRGISYVLIGGDDDMVPAQGLLCEAPGISHPDTACDIYFSCLDGTYNYDGDSYWGEPTDGENGGDVDLLAEVYVGRACVGSSEEVNIFINKTIAYDQSRSENLSTALFVGEYLGDGDYGGDYADQLIDTCSLDGYETNGVPSEDYHIDCVYERDRPGHDWPVEEIIDRVNNGVHYISHIGHANYDHCMKIYPIHLDEFNNTDLCFIYSQGCWAGCFDAQHGLECIAEYFTVKSPYIAFAGVFNARNGWGIIGSTDGPSQRYHREFWDAVFGENIWCISQANQDSKEDNLYRVNEECMRYLYYELNYFGDPTLMFHSERELEIEECSSSFGAISTQISNVGWVHAQDIEWMLSVTGGVFQRMKMTVTGSRDVLPPGESFEIQTDGVLMGLGRFTVNVTVASPQTAPVIRYYKGLALGPFLILY